MAQVAHYKDESEAVLSEIPALPPEIISKICGCADQSVLQCLRQVSKQINEYAEPELFRVVHLRVSKASFEKLANIGDADHLREYVKVLTYDGRLLPWNLGDYFDWEDCLGSAPGWKAMNPRGNSVAPKDVSNSIIKVIRDDEMVAYWDEYRTLLEDQKTLHRGDQECGDLVQIIACFPKLTSLYLDTGLWKEPTEISFEEVHIPWRRVPCSRRPDQLKMLIDSLSHLSAAGQRCLIEPGFVDDTENIETMKPPTSTFGVKRLWALIEASRHAGRHITCFCVEWLDLHHVSQKIELPSADYASTLRDFLSRLTHLTIRMGDWGCSLESWDHAASLIGLAKNVTSLEIEGNSEDSHLKGRQARMTALFEQKFPKLNKLIIKGLWIDVDMFQTFVNAHQNLSQLTLHNAHYTEGVQQVLHEYEDPTGKWGKAELRHYSTNVDPKLEEESKSKLRDFLEGSHVKYFRI